MRLELPPLNAIPAFEAAARHKSFTRAAEELYVTHGAISRQVKNLEEYLGQQLFRRLPRSLELTPPGRTYLEVVRQSLSLLSDGTKDMRRHQQDKPITISVIPSFAVRWLVPRLDRFYRAHPGIEVLLNASFSMVDFSKEDIDLAIRLGGGNWGGLNSELLMTIDITPVCSPALMEGEHPLDSPGSLAHHTLLHDTTRDGWRAWLRLSGVKGVDHQRGPLFNDHNVLLQAAIDGLGVGLARKRLVKDDLANGRLVQPFPVWLPSEVAYYIVFPKRRSNPKLDAFKSWLLEEANNEKD